MLPAQPATAGLGDLLPVPAAETPDRAQARRGHEPSNQGALVHPCMTLVTGERDAR
jgi:hypothetical protein